MTDEDYGATHIRFSRLALRECTAIQTEIAALEDRLMWLMQDIDKELDVGVGDGSIGGDIGIATPYLRQCFRRLILAREALMLHMKGADLEERGDG